MTHGDRLGHSWRDGQASVPRPRLRFRRHDPRRARAVRGHRRARLSRTRARLAGRARPPLRQSRQPAAIFSPPTMPRAWWCGRAPPPTTPRPTPTRVAAQNLVRLAVLTGQRCLARQGRPAVRRHAGRRGRESVRPPRAAQRARPAPARRRDRRDRQDARADALLDRRAQAPLLDRIVLRAPRRRCRRRIRRRRRSRPRRKSAAFVCVGETCSLPVTDTGALAEAVSATRPHAASS